MINTSSPITIQPCNTVMFSSFTNASSCIINVRQLLPVSLPHNEAVRRYFGRPGRREAATLADHRYQTSLTVVSRQKRRFVTPVTLQNAGSTLFGRGSVEYAEIYDVGQKDHYVAIASSTKPAMIFLPNIVISAYSTEPLPIHKVDPAFWSVTGVTKRRFSRNTTVSEV